MPLTGPQTTGNLTNARWTKYLPEYQRAAQFERNYDALAMGAVVPDERMADLYRSSSIKLNFIGDMEPGTATIPESLDVPSTAVRDAQFEITPTSRYGLIESSELLMNSASTNYAEERFYILGKNHAETVDMIAKDKANTGGSVNRAAARTSLDAGTAAHLLRRIDFMNSASDLMTKKVPALINEKRPMWMAFVPPYAFDDLLTDTPILTTGEYQKASIVLANELGELGRFKIIVSPWIKTFFGGGAANASAIETTVSGAVSQLAKTMVVASATNIDVGDWLMVGTHETGDTHYATNERVQVVTVVSTTIGISGEGANGGFRFDHADGVAVSNDDNVGSVVYGGPKSLAKMYDPNTGEYGEVLPPERVGALKHIYQLGWKWLENLATLYSNVLDKISNIGENLKWQLRGGYAFA